MHAAAMALARVPAASAQTRPGEAPRSEVFEAEYAIVRGMAEREFAAFGALEVERLSP